VDEEFQDLLPLFLTEGKRRLEHLLELAPEVGDRKAATEARRELHTLKGSSRMLQLRDIAELCHAGESLLQQEDITPAAFTELLDQLGQHLGELARSDEAEAAAEEETPEKEEMTDHRISVDAADRLTGSTAAIRLLTLSGMATAGRLLELAQLAHENVDEVNREQVLAMLATQLRQVGNDLEGTLHRLLQHAEGQLKRLLDLQLQPLRPYLQNLARHARELARDLNREVEVEVEGGDEKLDQRIAQELQGAFLHLVRNAVDHGIEPPDERLRAGKPRVGKVSISASSLGDRVEIVVSDDGAGVDPERILEVGRERGLVRSEVSNLSEVEMLQLLFTTGFSTRRDVSEVSGRGVGLDAVSTLVRQLGGDIWMDSKPGRGSSVFVSVPAARRGERVLILRSGFERLALPKSNVRWVRAGGHHNLVVGDGGLLADIDGDLMRVVALPDLLGLGEMPAQPVLIDIQASGVDRILAVEEVEGEAEVLVRPFAAGVPAPACYSGVALLPSGEPVAVLAPRALINQAVLAPRRSLPASQPERLRVLLVEDSLVTREMERRMLEDEGFLVTATAGAEEALGRLGEETYDCVVTDFEMPDMDGLELTRKVRGMERLAQLPIIIVSTRDQPGDRLAGLEAGADAYVTKQALEAAKLAAIIRRLGSGG
jgi:chemotaxis protein histidine kinase CheA/CheY-like chemotaxis protein